MNEKTNRSSPNSGHPTLHDKGDQPDTGWWKTNRQWALPVAIGCGVGVLVLALFIATIFRVVSGAMQSSWAYSEGLALAISNPEVTAAMGQPVTARGITTGSIATSGSSGEADLAIPLQGPAGKGTLYVVAGKRAGRWSFELAVVDVDGRAERIDLLVDSPSVETTR